MPLNIRVHLQVCRCVSQTPFTLIVDKSSGCGFNWFLDTIAEAIKPMTHGGKVGGK